MVADVLKTAVVVLVLGVTLALLPGGEAQPNRPQGNERSLAKVSPVKKNLLPSSGKSGRFILFI